MEPTKQDPRRTYPTSYDEYVQLCQRNGIDAQLDQPMFESALRDFQHLRDAFGGTADGSKSHAINYLQGLSEEEILQKLGISLHLEELANAAKTS